MRLVLTNPYMVALRHFFYSAVAWKIAIFVNSATVIKVSNAEIGGDEVASLGRAVKHDSSNLIKYVFFHYFNLHNSNV